MRKKNIEELGRISVDEYKRKKKLPLSIFLDNVRSLNNVGSVFRTADAFLLDKIYLTGYTGRPPHRDITKTALGATESVDWEHDEGGVELAKRLKSEGKKLVAIEQAFNSINLKNCSLEENEHIVLIFGSEVGGVNQTLIDLCDEVVEIPQFGTKHSLNISISVGIAVWQYASPVI